jgi:catechol 2,3-dioxygenase-like lactoylglutathione lyase family enzyme
MLWSKKTGWVGQLLGVGTGGVGTPDGHGGLELTKYHAPAAAAAAPQSPPPNTLGLHRLMFAVDDINDTVARLQAHGAELLGEIAQYESTFLLCYLRGPAGIIVALAGSASQARTIPSNSTAIRRISASGPPGRSACRVSSQGAAMTSSSGWRPSGSTACW